MEDRRTLTARGKIEEVKKEMRRREQTVSEPTRYAKVPKPEREINLREWQETIWENFPDLLVPAEAGLSVVAQLLIRDVTNPFGLVYVDVPSSAKTICLNFFSGLGEKLVYATDKFSPASWVSHAANVKKKDLEKIDLLPRIRWKLLLVRDLAPLFGQRDDDLRENLAILTRVFDGEGLQIDSGLHGQRAYQGDYLFMFLGASTPMEPRVWGGLKQFGTRLYFLNMNTPRKSSEELTEQVTEEKPYKEKEKKCRLATRDFVWSLWNNHPEGIEWKREDDPKNVVERIAKVSQLLAILRGNVDLKTKLRQFEFETTFDYSPPVIEQPDRINQVLYNFARGHALVCGRYQINEEEIQFVHEVALDSAPLERVYLLNALLANKGSLTTTEVEEKLRCSKPTALEYMKVFTILGVTEHEEVADLDPGRPEFRISLGREFNWLLDGKQTEKNTMSDLVN